MRAILHVLNYAASYRGNFIESLSDLDEKLQTKGMKNIYLFVQDAKLPEAMSWIREMQATGQIVEFLSGNRRKDTQLIKKVINKYDVAIIHTHFITMNQYLAIYQAVWGSKMPLVMHMHNHSREVKNFIKNTMRRILYSRCVMVACSQSVFQSLERDYPKNEKYTIDNGVNFNRLDHYEVLDKKHFGLSEDEKVLLIFGFDFFRKGVDLAVRALDKLRKAGHKYSLLVSLSTNFEIVEKYIRDMMGEMPSWIKIIPARNDAATLYNFADVFLSPSREEGLPYSVIEAGYSKCSVVLSDISAQKYMKIPYSYWFESENIEKLAEQIIQAEKGHVDKIKNLEEVQQAIREQYILATWSQKIIDLYQKILER